MIAAERTGRRAVLPEIGQADPIIAERARVGAISRVIAQSRGRIAPGILDQLHERAGEAGWSADILLGVPRLSGGFPPLAADWADAAARAVHR